MKDNPDYVEIGVENTDRVANRHWLEDTLKRNTTLPLNFYELSHEMTSLAPGLRKLAVEDLPEQIRAPYQLAQIL